jgi:acetyl esterase/lipase
MLSAYQYSIAYLIVSFLCFTQLGMGQDPKANRIALWTDKAPIGDGQFQESQAWLTPHIAPNGNGSAIVICPGGGYGSLVTGGEGHGIAAWLNQHNITGLVLEYRLPKGKSMVPLLDAQRAIRLARLRADEWKLKTNRIGIMGFSAGGHLASTAGTHFDSGKPDAKDPVERLSCRPDFMILVYPVIYMGDKAHSGSQKNLLGENPTLEQIALFSNDKQVTVSTPPTFMAHAIDDKPVPIEHSRAFYSALLGAKVPCKLLELPSGGHGLNGYKGPMWDQWQRESLEWLSQLP